jgi:eukaryotic-like serine/threonine-protein kinase
MVLRSRSRPRTYDLRARVATGGMGEVYEAFSPDLNRRVAVKRMLDADASDDDLRMMFLREVAVAATLEHHNVVEVLDAGQNGTELFLVMEYVDGPALAEIIEVLKRQNRILPVEISCHVVSCVAQGLNHAHERALPDGTSLGIVHRDVAPENVLIGSEGIPKIVDFGLAKLSGHSLTQPGTIRGRPRSLSPEQARGDTVDVRSDVFSMGAMLFELVAGQALYPSEQMATMLYKVAAGEYPPIGPRLRHVDADLVKIIQTAINIDPAERFRSTREMDRQLESFRAARGMRVSARTVAQVVQVVWPAVEAARRQRLEGTQGELEGARLILPADRLDTQAELDYAAKDKPAKPKAPKAPPARVGGSAASPPPVRPATMPPHRTPSLEPMTMAGEMVTPDLPSGLGSASGSGDLGRSAGLPPAAWPSELPKPAAPAKDLGGGSQLGWLLYLAAVLVLAALAFGGAWIAGEPGTAPTEARTAAESPPNE